MRNGQHQHHNHNKRMRGRNNNHSNNNNNNNRRNHNPLTRVYESNGPDVKIRGTANHVAEKYLQLARDAQTSGDPIAAENYFQHAEHYFRLIAVAQEQFRQQNPNFQPPRPEGSGGNDQQFAPRNEGMDDGGEDDGQSFNEFAAREQPQPSYPPREQPYLPRDAQPFVPRDNQNYQPREQRNGQPQEARQEPRQEPRQERPQPQPRPQPEASHDALPAFITGGAPPPVAQQAQDPNSPNGFDNGQPDRFPLHRRRRRHRGPRDGQGPQGGSQSDDSGGE